jgi:hypothetical protein
MKTKGKQLVTQSKEPSSRNLFKPVKSFLELANILRKLWVREPKGLKHEHSFS